MVIMVMVIMVMIIMVMVIMVMVIMVIVIMIMIIMVMVASTSCPPISLCVSQGGGCQASRRGEWVDLHYTSAKKDSALQHISSKIYLLCLAHEYTI